MKKITKDNLDAIREENRDRAAEWIKVGLSTCGIAAGGEEVYNTLAAEVRKRNLPVEVRKTGCLGSCHCEPLVEVQTIDMPRVIYGRVNKDVALKIIEEHVVGKKLLQDQIYDLRLNCQG